MNVALVLAGGTGTRLGADMPKQYLRVCDRMIITYCLEEFAKSNDIDKIWIVANEEWHNTIKNEIGQLPDCLSKFVDFCAPGDNRQLSIVNGLTAVRNYCLGVAEDVAVMIHDAARPCISQELIKRCFASVKGHDGVMPVIPMKDTIYMSEDGKQVTSLLDRSKLFAGQSPEVFKLEPYYEACKSLMPDRILSINGSTEPAIIAGLDIAIVAGDEANYKITTMADLERFKEQLQ